MVVAKYLGLLTNSIYTVDKTATRWLNVCSFFVTECKGPHWGWGLWTSVSVSKPKACTKYGVWKNWIYQDKTWILQKLKYFNS